MGRISPVDDTGDALSRFGSADQAALSASSAVSPRYSASASFEAHDSVVARAGNAVPSTAMAVICERRHRGRSKCGFRKSNTDAGLRRRFCLENAPNRNCQRVQARSGTRFAVQIRCSMRVSGVFGVLRKGCRFALAALVRPERNARPGRRRPRVAAARFDLWNAQRSEIVATVPLASLQWEQNLLKRQTPSPKTNHSGVGSLSA